jgi:adenylate cyclase
MQPIHSSKTLSQPRSSIQSRPRDFAKPVRNYKIVGQFDQDIVEPQLIREEQDGFRVFLDLGKLDKASAVQTLETILSRLRS